MLRAGAVDSSRHSTSNAPLPPRPTSFTAMVAPPLFQPFSIEGQRTLEGAPWTGTSAEGKEFPLAAQVDSSIQSLDDFVSAIDKLASEGKLKPLLHEHGGAILFRGTHAKNAEDFSRIVLALQLGPQHEELGNPVVRNARAKGVSTANEGPADHPVFPHSCVSLRPERGRPADADRPHTQ